MKRWNKRKHISLSADRFELSAAATNSRWMLTTQKCTFHESSRFKLQLMLLLSISRLLLVALMQKTLMFYYVLVRLMLHAVNVHPSLYWKILHYLFNLCRHTCKSPSSFFIDSLEKIEKITLGKKCHNIPGILRFMCFWIIGLSSRLQVNLWLFRIKALTVSAVLM